MTKFKSILRCLISILALQRKRNCERIKTAGISISTKRPEPAMERIQITHPIPPLYDENSELLILGSFPSVKSREAAFFYGHPQNRFWRVLAALYGESVPQTITEKKEMLARRHVALWDVIASCSIVGSSDSSIRDVVANDLRPILRCSRIDRIYANGGTAARLYHKYIEPQLGIPAVCLPSTSPANAAWTMEMLTAPWRRITVPFGRSVSVAVDRPLGSRHPEHPDLVYPVNYGYVPGVTAPDGEEQDAYLLGVDTPVERYCGVVLGAVHRLDDVEDKWIVTPEGCSFTAEEIREKLHFQEQFFRSELWLWK